MSEKQVNIKITANTKDFNSAIDKAKKEIESLAEALENLSANKIGEKIEEQFSNLSKVIKELEDKINAIVGSFDKLDKAKLDKTEDGLDDASKAAEKLSDSLDDAADSAKELDDSTKSINYLGKEYEKAQESLEGLSKEYDEAINKQKELSDAYEQSKEETKSYADQIRKLEDIYKKANEDVEKQKEAMAEPGKNLENLNATYRKVKEEFEEVTAAAEKQQKVYDDICNEVDRLQKKTEEYGESAKKTAKEANKLNKAITAIWNERARINGNLIDYAMGKIDSYPGNRSIDMETLERLGKEEKELEKRHDRLKKSWDDYAKKYKETQSELNNLIKEGAPEEDKLNEIAEQYNELERVCNKLEKELGPLTEKFNEMEQELGTLEKTADDAAKELDDLRRSFDDAKAKEDFNKDELEKAAQAVKDYKDAMDDAEGAIRRFNEEAEKQASEFDNHYKAYERLSKWVEKYISDESKAITLRGQVAESFEKVAKAMEGVYDDSKKLNNMEKVNKVLQESKEYLDDFNLVSLDNVTEELDRFSKRLEDTIDKQKRYKAVAKEFGTDDSKEAYRIQKQAEALREWADSADFVIQASDKLSKAWGNISAAGEDNLQIRERSKMMDEYGKTLKENVAHIQNYYKELKTLDEVYEKCTDEEKAIIDDYKYWEKNKEKLDDYNQAIRDYLTVIKETGGQISDKFKDDLGNFDIKKFIENYEKFGEANNVLKKSMEALKIKTLASVESLIQNAEANKRAAKEAVAAAEAARDQAKAEEKAAQSQEERIEAARKLAKAEEELAEAKQKVKNFDQDLLDDMDKLIKKFNEGAEAARKLGINMKEITKADISKITGGKSWASLLDGMDTFGNDLPKTFDEVKRQIKALFADMEGLDFGSVFDGLKGLAAGALGKLPIELQLAATAAVALAAGLKECAEIGINQFTRGMDTISGALSGIIGIGRSIGTEVRDAFENITNMHLDASSLMEIPVMFEAQMMRVKAIGEMTEEEFERLEELAIKLGATTRYGATEVAEAMEYMGQAGWDSTEIEKGVEAVLNLATVADMDLSKASETVTDIINAFKNAGKNSLTAEDAGMVADLLNTAAVKTSTSIEQLKSSFSNVAPIAGSFNMSIKDLVMSLGLMGDQGVKGAKAGTALKNIITNMNRPTQEQLAIMKKYNLLGARKAMVDGDLLGGIRLMKSALDGLSVSERNQVIEAVAGQEALSGVSALLNSSTEDINELEAAMNNCNGSAKAMADEFDKSLKGALDNLAGSLETTIIQIGKKVEPAIAGIVNEITKFFNILNGFETSGGGLTGIAGAMEHLEETTRGWGDAISDGLTKAINSIDDFLNSASFDNLLQAGTNIIDGIADGIRRAADDGSLDSAISTAIGKIADWFADNLETVIEVGEQIIDAISKGISENSDEIGRVIRAVMEMQTEIDKAIAKEKWKLIGQNLISFICEGIVSKVSVFVSAFTGFFSGAIGDIANAFSDLVVNKLSPMLFDPIATLGESIGNYLQEILLSAIERAFDIDLSFLKGFNILNPTTWFGGGDKKKTTSNKKTTSKSSSSKSSSSSGSGADIINKELSAVKPKTDATAASIGQGISDNITSKLETMDATQLKALDVEMKNLQSTVTALGAGMSASFTVIQDSARTAFMNFTNIVRNQMLNCTNIVRNQCINWYNIINNQVTNARNALTSQFLSMAAVARTQMVNISNIVRNQAVTWKNIISNQVKNARDALTKQFMSMAAVARTQMSKVASAVSSSMSQVAASTGRSMSMNVNVNRTVATGYAMPSANALYAANAGATFSLGNNMSTFASNASYAAPSGNSGSSSNSSAGGGMVIEVPLYLDGKVVAKATARYVDNELKQMTKRENRKRGAK